MYTEIRFMLNGEQKVYTGDPLRRLLDVLRDDSPGSAHTPCVAALQSVTAMSFPYNQHQIISYRM